MRRIIFQFAFILVTLLTINTVQAQNTLPRAARLPGMRLVWQQYNRCSAAALSMMLWYHGWTGTYDTAILALNPHAGDVSVRSDEMIAFVEQQGFKAIVRTGGTLDILKALVAAGYPVLVENAYTPEPGNWTGHNRVIMGYDDDANLLYAYDSSLGNGIDGMGKTFNYEGFDLLWKPFNRTYLVIYKPEHEAQLQAILGDQWDATYNALWTSFQAENDLALDVNDPYAWFNMSVAQVALDNPERAVTAFEAARQLDVPSRLLWYQFAPFEAYLKTGRYEETIALGQEIIDSTTGVEEVYYYMGEAYAAMGNVQNASSYYQQTLSRNARFAPAQTALTGLAAS
jgi:hypothetical protein